MQCLRSIPKEITKNKPLRFTFSKIRRTWSFHVVVLQMTGKKCTKIQNAHVCRTIVLLIEPFVGGVLVGVAVVVC